MEDRPGGTLHLGRTFAQRYGIGAPLLIVAATGAVVLVLAIWAAT